MEYGSGLRDYARACTREWGSACVYKNVAPKIVLKSPVQLWYILYSSMTESRSEQDKRIKSKQSKRERYRSNEVMVLQTKPQHNHKDSQMLFLFSDVRVQNTSMYILCYKYMLHSACTRACVRGRQSHNLLITFFIAK